MRRLIRWSIILAVLVALSALGYAPAYNYWKEKTKVRFRDAEVTRGKIVAVVNATGTVKPVLSVSVGAFVSGPIERILVNHNEIVSKDQLLAQVDQKIYKAKVLGDKATLATQVAAVARVKANLQQARNNEMRALALHKENKSFISAQELDQFHFGREALEADLLVAEATVELAQATLDKSLADLDYCLIRSPVDGIVIDRKIEPGQTVASSFQTPELFIVAPDLEAEIYIFASVDEGDIGLIDTAQKAGEPVRFTVDSWPDDRFDGKVVQIRMNATTIQNVVTYPVIVSAKNPGMKLKPSMTASISFQLKETGEVTRIPNAALRYYPQREHVRLEDREILDNKTPAAGETEEGVGSGRSADEKAELRRNRNRRHVWVQEGDFLRAVPVTIGVTSSQHTELVTGELKAGDRLVTGLQPKQ